MVARQVALGPSQAAIDPGKMRQFSKVHLSCLHAEPLQK